MTEKPDLSVETVTNWLARHCETAVESAEPLAGGYWSAAFAFQHKGADLVVRFNKDPEGFVIDQNAAEMAASSLPVPKVWEIGEALGVHYAFSTRHHGSFLELADPVDAAATRVCLDNLFTGLRRVPSQDRVEWYDPASTLGWRDYLKRSLESHRSDAPAPTDVARIHKEALSRIESLLRYCPERRDLVHGDLLHQNTLISADELRAVFSWKCSAFGDFAYDIAWCTHWSPWHPGIAAVDVIEMTLNSTDLGPEALEKFSERHHCYELQIAASHLDWYLWTRDDENLMLLADNLNTILNRGPVQ